MIGFPEFILEIFTAIITQQFLLPLDTELRKIDIDPFSTLVWIGIVPMIILGAKVTFERYSDSAHYVNLWLLTIMCAYILLMFCTISTYLAYLFLLVVLTLLALNLLCVNNPTK